MGKTLAQMETELKRVKANAERASAESKKKIAALKEANTQAVAPAVASTVAILGPPQPRFIEGRKVAVKTYFSHSFNLFIDKVYYDYVRNCAAKDMDQVKFDGHWKTTDNEQMQKCIESNFKFGKQIKLVTKANRAEFVTLERALRKTNYYTGPATTATAKGEVPEAVSG